MCWQTSRRIQRIRSVTWMGRALLPRHAGPSARPSHATGCAFRLRYGQLFIYPTPSAGQAVYTLASWGVSDLAAQMADLRAYGMSFEEYDLPGLRTVAAVAERGIPRGCWFKDSEGNIRGLTESRGP